MTQTDYNAHSLEAEMNALREENAKNLTYWEEAKPRLQAEHEVRMRKSQQIIDDLNTRSQEIQRYEQMGLWGKFFYRLFHRPAWL